LLVFAADPGAFAALGAQNVGVAGVGIAPAQVFLQELVITGDRGLPVPWASTGLPFRSAPTVTATSGGCAMPAADVRVRGLG
jgi:hypothetical protein